jgi:hypothetical protein
MQRRGRGDDIDLDRLLTLQQRDQVIQLGVPDTRRDRHG